MLYYIQIHSVIKMIKLALWHFEPEMSVINIEWLNRPKTAGTSASWRSTMTMSSSSLGTATELRGHTTIWETVNGQTERQKRRGGKKKDIKRMKGRDIWDVRDGNGSILATSGKLLSSSLRHYLFILISTQRRRQLKRYRCLFLAWPFFTRIPRQNADTGFNTNTPHGDSRWQSHKPFLPSLYSHMPLSADTRTRSSHRSVRTAANSISHFQECSIVTVPHCHSLHRSDVFLAVIIAPLCCVRAGMSEPHAHLP